MNQTQARERLFSGKYPAGIVYADRGREKGGDYARLGFLSYRTLVLDIEADCPPAMRQLIELDAKEIQDKKGELYQVSTCDQFVRLGE